MAKLAYILGPWITLTRCNQPFYSLTMHSSPSEESIASRLRTIRKARGWSLAHVEKLSRGQISAVALGSYERSDRALSLARLLQLAHFYEIPLTHLISEPIKSQNLDSTSRLIVDLRGIKSQTQLPESDKDPILVVVTALLASIAHRRCDWNAEVMTLRQSDLSTLSLMAMKSEEEIVLWLKAKNLVVRGRDHL